MAIGFMTAAALALMGDSIFPLPPEAQKILAAKEQRPQLSDCRKDNPSRPWELEICRLGGKGEPTFLLWGDSHAGALAPGVDLAAYKLGETGALFWRPGCPPLVKIDRINPNHDCARTAAQALAWLDERPTVSVVLLASRWAIYAEGKRFGRQLGAGLQIADAELPDDTQSVFARGVERTVSALAKRGIKVIVVQQVPEVEVSPPEAIAMAMRFGRGHLNISPSWTAYSERTAFVEKSFFPALQSGAATQLSLADYLCVDALCPVREPSDGLLRYSDETHLSVGGAERLSDLIAQSLARELMALR